MTAAAWLAVFLLLFTSPPATHAAEPLRLRLALHVHTTVSTGALEPSEILPLAEQAGIDGVIFTDSARRRWEYGLWPLRGLLKRVVEQPSVSTFGAHRYVETIQHLNADPTGVMAMAGLEVAPFYYWHRSPFHREGGQIRDWQQHLLVMGLEDPAAIQALPLDAFDPYHGDRGAAPYQRLIDVVTGRGGLVFWAHPEMPLMDRYGSVEAYTEAYPHLLRRTTGYHGFAITYLDRLTFVEPGEVWDRLLGAYCRGMRSRPVWIVGELDWRNRRLDERPLNAAVTEVLAQSRSPEAILQALRAGRMWVVLRRPNYRSAPALLAVTMTDVSSGAVATVGERLTPTGPIRIEVTGTRSDDVSRPVRLLVIKDGTLKEVEFIHQAQFTVVWEDAAPAQAGFYRFVIDDPAGLIYTNPIFVQ